MNDERIRDAEAFLQEAVFRSRASQATSAALGGARLDREPAPGGCGLGHEAALELDLSPAAAEIFGRLWPGGPEPSEVERTRDLMRDWITRQDALDRKRNHFLRDFRQAHGFDRAAYSAAELEEYETGLARINGEVRERLRGAARELLRADG